MPDGCQVPGGPARDLCHPLPLGAVALLVVNDHWLKGAGILPPWLTGKLSDFAGLFFFPLLLAACARSLLALADRMGPRAEVAVAAGSALATAAAFSLLKLHAGFNGWVASVWVTNVLDVTDLLALPSCGLSFAWMRWRQKIAQTRPQRSRKVVQVSALAAAALASVATSPPRVVYPRNYPSWQITAGPTHHVGCAQLQAWVSKSGKEGVGLSIAKLTGEPCTVRVVSAKMVIGGDRILAAQLPAAADGNLYVPFVFDNEARWNAGERTADFALVIEAGESRFDWTVSARHVRERPHREVWRYGKPDAGVP